MEQTIEVESDEIIPAEAESEQEAPTETTRYVANRRLAVGTGKDGQKRYREPGEEIPEAEDWSSLTRARYIQEGHISQVIVLRPKPGRPRKQAAKRSS